ncbi:hypothetical protein [Hydrocarboniphaga effusa]|uniref:ATP-binding protein n=1 Tax=Hydrocarboniphaga effusa AP103 TaxID=1172194 RepID=I7ZJU7_9GAMM|nr:hypothetical protein [Hydrocarboniphaga effusa]EIT72012.1 hypothetical protein WQQ_21490 [Hydrocarboniphaga effusa AP103]
MTISTNLRGRLRNTSLPLAKGLMPLFEAVTNSLQAIAALHPTEPSAGSILVEILRRTQAPLALADPKSKSWFVPTEPIVGFRVVDDGIGFDDRNFKSFEQLDTDHKEREGCRGVGRLLWLKAFKSASIVSTYEHADGVWKQRRFTFDDRQGVSLPVVEDVQSAKARRTEVHLDAFLEGYRDKSPKTGDVIARAIFEHCLWYFLRDGGAPDITIKDGAEAIPLETVYNEYMYSSTKKTQLEIQGHAFELTHLKLRTSIAKQPFISLCAGGRMVEEEALRPLIPGLLSKVRDPEGDFVYACHVTSPYLNSHVRPERIGFDMMESSDLHTEGEVTRSELRSVIAESAKAFLKAHLEDGKNAARARVESFVARKAPRYRPILAHIDEDKLIVDPEISDRELDLLLHKHLAEIEGGLIAEGHAIMRFGEKESVEGYRERLQRYMSKIDDLKKSDLANYVFHRKVILDIFAQATQIGVDGKYKREDVLHEMIMPMRRSSDEAHFDSFNLWLIDERLAFHDYLASDMPLTSMPITDSIETKEPDLVALNVYDEPILVSDRKMAPFAALTIVEIKRPMRNDAAPGEDKDPLEQVLGYLDRLRSGEITHPSGRPIPNAKEMPGFCYVVSDLTPKFIHRCRMLNLHPTSDGMGFFGYNDAFKAYIEVSSYDRLLVSARERNRAFFDKLGLPTN